MAGAFCTYPTSVPNMLGRSGTLPPINKVTRGPAYPTLTYFSMAGYTGYCDQGSPNTEFWAAIPSVSRPSASSLLSGFVYVGKNEVRNTVDLNPPGWKTAIGQNIYGDPEDSYAYTYTGVQVLTPPVLTCSGGSSSATTSDYLLPDGRGVALLKCKTDGKGSMWVMQSNYYGRVYQASTDGAIGELNNEPLVGLSNRASGPSSTPGFLSGVLTAPSREAILAKLNSTDAIPSCAGSTPSTSSALVDTCLVGPSSGGAYISSPQAQAPVTCTLEVNGQSNAKLNWVTPVPASTWGWPGTAIAEAKTASILLSCTGRGTGALNTIRLGARGEVSQIDGGRFSSSNASVDYAVVVKKNGFKIVPNVLYVLTSTDGVVYTPQATGTQGTLDLTVTPVVASTPLIPGRADARVILDIFAGL